MGVGEKLITVKRNDLQSHSTLHTWWKTKNDENSHSHTVSRAHTHGWLVVFHTHRASRREDFIIRFFSFCLSDFLSFFISCIEGTRMVEGDIGKFTSKLQRASSCSWGDFSPFLPPTNLSPPPRDALKLCLCEREKNLHNFCRDREK